MTKLPRRNGELTGEAHAEGWAIYEPATGTVHVLNESARAIWELCDGETSLQEMAEAITELTGVPLEETLQDVETTVNRLLESGLLSTK